MNVKTIIVFLVLGVPLLASGYGEGSSKVSGAPYVESSYTPPVSYNSKDWLIEKSEEI